MGNPWTKHLPKRPIVWDVHVNDVILLWHLINRRGYGNPVTGGTATPVKYSDYATGDTVFAQCSAKSYIGRDLLRKWLLIIDRTPRWHAFIKFI